MESAAKVEEEKVWKERWVCFAVGKFFNGEFWSQNFLIHTHTHIDDIIWVLKLDIS